MARCKYLGKQIGKATVRKKCGREKKYAAHVCFAPAHVVRKRNGGTKPGSCLPTLTPNAELKRLQKTGKIGSDAQLYHWCHGCKNKEYESMDLKSYFRRVVVISLVRRPDRLKEFYKLLPEDWPFKHPEHFEAIDRKLCPSPGWWKQGGGAWGCYRSHATIIEQELIGERGNVLILEDDAIFAEDFAAKVKLFLETVPDDWDQLYLGGQHLRPIVSGAGEGVVIPRNINRTHAYAVSTRGLKPIYQHLMNTKDWHNGHHIDHHYGKLHASKTAKIYCPVRWLVGQGASSGKSDVNGKERTVDRFWIPGDKSNKKPDPKTDGPFHAIIGPHASGTSACAGVLWHLGMDLGDNLVGYWGNRPGKECGYEAKSLMRICEQAFSLPRTRTKQPKAQRYRNLRGWIVKAIARGKKKDCTVGGKYPYLCQLGDQLINICGPNLVVVAVDRPIEDAVASLAKRFPKMNLEKLRVHQQWLDDGKEDLLTRAKKGLRVDFDALRAEPEPVIRQLAGQLGLDPTDDQFAAAIASVRGSTCENKKKPCRGRWWN